MAIHYGALLGVLQSFRLLSNCLPQLTRAARAGRAVQRESKVVVEETWVGEGAGVADGVLFSQASFVYVLSQMWLIRGKCSKSNRLLLVWAGKWWLGCYKIK